ncbi:MAG: sodium:calcium antiporter [Firmicutes bacterium]|nr:sodium:calcium antiporter [Bacillota bacterium]
MRTTLLASLGYLLAGMALIILAADFFTNAVEWQGRIWGLGEAAVGSLLAAVGTALPETTVPVIALLSGRGGEHAEIGLGAIIGAPLMLATVGFAVVGGAVVAARGWSGTLAGGTTALRADLDFYLGAFGLVVVAAFLPAWSRWLVAAALGGAYLWHARALLRRGGEAGEAPRPLRLWPGGPPPALVVAGQLLGALAVMVAGARLFVRAVNWLALGLHLSGFLLAVVLTPMATELPEVLNSVFWVGRGRDVLAAGNVSGAMVFQASVVPALGMLLLGRWQLSGWQLVSALVAWAGALLVRLETGRGRPRGWPWLLGGGIYLAFAVLAGTAA